VFVRIVERILIDSERNPLGVMKLVLAILSSFTARNADVNGRFSKKLSKRICQRCYEKRGINWHAGYDRFWHNCCAMEDSWKFEEGDIITYAPNIPLWFVPEKCPFRLEHLMETQNDLPVKCKSM